MTPYLEDTCGFECVVVVFWLEKKWKGLKGTKSLFESDSIRIITEKGKIYIWWKMQIVHSIMIQKLELNGPANFVGSIF